MQALGSRRGGVGHPCDRRAGSRGGGDLRRVPAPGPTGGGRPAARSRQRRGAGAPQITFAVHRGERLGDLKVAVDGGTSPGGPVRGAAASGRLGQARPGPSTRSGSATPATTSSRAPSRATGASRSTPTRRSWPSPPPPRLPAPPPGREVRGPRRAGRRRVGRLRGRLRHASANAAGAWNAVARLPEGPVTATVTAADAAGNTTVRERTLTVDTTPRARPQRPGGGRPASPRPTSRSSTARSRPGQPPRPHLRGRGQRHARGHRQGVDATRPRTSPRPARRPARRTAALEVDGRRFSMAVGTLPQGRNTIAVKVRDRAGNVCQAHAGRARQQHRGFGASDLRAGAQAART